MGTKTSDDAPDTVPPDDLSALFREHIEEIRRMLSSGGLSRADVDDVLQKVLLAAFRGIHTFDPGSGTFRAWLCGIARNEAAQHWRTVTRSRERLSSDEEPMDVPDNRPDAEARLLEADRRRELEALLLQIPPARRAIVKAFELSEMTLKELAESLLIPEGTVKTRLRRGREELEAAVRRERARRRERGLLPLLPIARDGFDVAWTTRWQPTRLLPRWGSPKWLHHTLAGGLAGALLVLTPNAPALEASPSVTAPAAIARTAPRTEEPRAQPGRVDRGEGATTARAMTTAPRSGATTALQGARGGVDEEEEERDLVQSAAAAMSARHWDVARRLLAEHRRRFLHGRHAGERERLLGSLRGVATARRVAPHL